MDQPHSGCRLGLRYIPIHRFTCRDLERRNRGHADGVLLCHGLYRYGAWTEWSNFTLACWAVVAPFLLGFGSVVTPMWAHVLIGLCATTIATMQLLADRKVHPLSSTQTIDSK